MPRPDVPNRGTQGSDQGFRACGEIQHADAARAVLANGGQQPPAGDIEVGDEPAPARAQHFLPAWILNGGRRCSNDPGGLPRLVLHQVERPAFLDQPVAHALAAGSEDTEGARRVVRGQHADSQSDP